MMLTLTLGTFFQAFLATTFTLLCLLLCLVIVVQKPRGGGLSGAFGGAGGGSQMFGGKAGDFLTWFTVGVFVLFVVFGMGLVVRTRHEARPAQEPEVKAADESAATLPELPLLPADTTADKAAPAATPPAEPKPAEPKAESKPAEPKAIPAVPPPPAPAPNPNAPK